MDRKYGTAMEASQRCQLGSGSNFDLPLVVLIHSKKTKGKHLAVQLDLFDMFPDGNLLALACFNCPPEHIAIL